MNAKRRIRTAGMTIPHLTTGDCVRFECVEFGISEFQIVDRTLDFGNACREDPVSRAIVGCVCIECKHVAILGVSTFRKSKPRTRPQAEECSSTNIIIRSTSTASVACACHGFY